ncbi:MAG: chromate transporter [Ruminococcus sp.]|nr:chromate transporter [Ruminococcus sp.]
MNIFLLLFLEFFKMGALTFGGGYAMIPFIEETVLRHGWMTTRAPSFFKIVIHYLLFLAACSFIA